MSELPQRYLGRTEVPVSCLGVGGYLGALRDADATDEKRIEAAIEAVRRAVDLGIRYFDTSPGYGDAERYLGHGLRALARAERDLLTVSTKVGTHPQRQHGYDTDGVQWCFARSVELLGRVDIVYVHDPNSDEHMDGILGPGGAFEALEQLRSQGTIRALGLGVRNHRFLRRAIDDGRCDAILPSYDYHPLRTTASSVLTQAASQGVGVANGSPYNAGLLAGIALDEAAARRQPHDADMARAVQLLNWCRERDVDLGALAVQHNLRCADIDAVLVGPRTAAEVEDCVRHATAEVPEHIWEELKVFVDELEPAAAPGGEVQ